MLGMILAHLCAIILGVYSNKFIGVSLIDMLNILFSAEMALYATFELTDDGFFYSGLAMFSIIAMNVMDIFCSFHK